MARRIAPVQTTDEIRLAGASRHAGLLGRLLGRGEDGRSPASLRLTGRAVLIEARSTFRGKLDVPLTSVRRALVDEGSGWAYATAVCRFPVYDRRSDGSGTGALIGPLWSKSRALLPESCPTIALPPVPEQPPNLALILEPCVRTPLARDQKPSTGPHEADTIALLLLHAEDPEAARELLAGKLELRDLDLEDLEYLSGPMRLAIDADDASAASA
jgi:hypothetical protein